MNSVARIAAWLAGAVLLAVLAAVLAAGAAAPGRAATLSGEVEVWETVAGQPSKLENRANAVIFVAGFNEPPPSGQEPELAQENKSFTQRVLVVTQGESVAFPNHDPIYHNVWSRSPGRPFDLGLYKAPEQRELPFPVPGIVTVFCNIHPQMIATILVLPNRRYAVTGPDGRYRIEGIPAGEHPVYAWVEGAQPIRQMVRFGGGNDHQQLGFRLTLQRIPLRHLNKEGKPYKSYAQE
jgi:plastocyanin